MAREPIRGPIDGFADDLVGLYETAARRLRVLVQAAVLNGSTWTADFRRAQLGIVEQIIAGLSRDSARTTRVTIERAYSAGALVVDDTTGLQGAFGGVHQGAVAELVDALDADLSQAIVTVGRSVDDIFRRMTLRSAALGGATGETGPQQSHTMTAWLEQEGMTAFVDRRGARWGLDTYSRMAIRTTNREAVSTATGNRLVELGQDLVTISQHAHEVDVCTPFEGRTYSLRGATRGYPRIGKMPPFHPNCVHVAMPSTVTFDRYEAAIEQLAAEL